MSPTKLVLVPALPIDAQAPCSASRSESARVKIPATTADYARVSVPELVRACVEGEAAAWLEFIRRYNRIIAVTAYRTARKWGKDSPAVVDDLTQEAYLKLCDKGARALRKFESPHPNAIFGFLREVTENAVHDYFKRRNRRKDPPDDLRMPIEDAERTSSAAGPASSDSMERSVLFDQLYACLSAVAPPETLQRDLTIFLLRYRQGLTVPQIASLPSIGLSIEGVESVLHRLMELLRTHLAETRPAKPSASEKKRTEKEFGIGNGTEDR